ELLARVSESILRETLPEEHWYLAIPRAQIGRAILAQGREAEAESLLVNSYEVLSQARGPNSPHTMFAASALISLYDARRDYETARRFRDDLAAGINRGSDVIAWATARQVFGPEHQELVAAVDEFTGLFYDNLHLLPEKLPAVLSATERQLSAGDARAGIIGDLLRGYADRYLNRDDNHEAALRMLRESLRLHRLSGAPSEIRLAMTHWWLAHVSATTNPIDGLEHGHEALSLFEKIVGTDDWMYANSQQVIAGNLITLGRFEEAARYAADGFKVLLVRQGPRNVNTYVALGRAIDAYGNWGHAELAAPLAEQVLDAWLELSGPMVEIYNHGGNAQSMLDITSRIFRYPGFPASTYSKALQGALYARDANPDDTRYLENAAVGFFRAGRFDEAIAEFAGLPAEEPTRRAYRECFHALALAARGERASAEAMLAGIEAIWEEHSEDSESSKMVEGALREARLHIHGTEGR
ncbi:MAG: hypothetical protein AB7N71_08635, partial [Phycisphaerae bacterium]